MPKQIIWSPLAEKDFEGIIEYLEKNWSEKIIHRFVTLTDELIDQIANNPKQFPLIHKNKKIRKCVLTKHNTMFYRERKEYVDILRIFDTRQNPQKLAL